MSSVSQAAVDGNQTPTVLGMSIFTLLVGGFFIALRTFTRTFIKRSLFGWDDVLIIATWFIILGYNICMWVSTTHGYGKHAASLSLYELEQTVKAEVIGQAFAIACFPTGKASVAILTAKIFPGKTLHRILLVIVILNMIFYVDTILILVQCNPVWKQWAFDYEGGSCWDPSVLATFGIVTGAIGCASDFILAAIPWFYVLKLKMNTQQKIGVGFALSAGFFAGCCSILKVYYTTRLTSRTDYAWDTIPLVLWSMAELCLINIAACIPTLAPLYQRIFHKGDFTRGSTAKSRGFYELNSGKQKSLFSKQGALISTDGPYKGTMNDEAILVQSTFTVEHGDRPTSSRDHQ